ncbi:guanylate kinase [Frankia sp. AgPm24]|uniref:guanylate kinase n=1 Tax=Frankia sp. AgPm24 TaxID=631128 RepID=UPI00200E75D6|nr:guanylate kinase [Frankia sp. AgPm24]MCK9921876.1 guanylate kinase [Frankia sp. AgPm24]
MPPDAVILYGPPASGKDTITAALTGRYVHFDRLKVGANARAPYRVASGAELGRLQAQGLILYANERYGNVYAIDRPRLDELIAAGRVPVVHLGQIAGIEALHTGYPARWVTASLWCPREVTEARARERGSTDVDARLTVWDETLADFDKAARTDLFDLVLRTDRRSPEQVADVINHAVTDPSAGTIHPHDPMD